MRSAAYRSRRPLRLVPLVGCGSGGEARAEDAGSRRRRQTGAAQRHPRPRGTGGAGPAGRRVSRTAFRGAVRAPRAPQARRAGVSSPEASVTRVKELAKSYEPYSEEKVIPAFEVDRHHGVFRTGPGRQLLHQSTVGAAHAVRGGRGRRTSVYVVLDLQPGQAQDFLAQAKRYEELLKRPNVGLALDAEWRLAPGQLPLQQIGSVDAAEINKTSQWLATLARDNQAARSR
ncbi:hypothetical protein QJS66_15115 [Kocuria rhizophila]|nr:hypothetical protein QJS66_15115 [Kocuria rhizophila]